ncbi:hypothetical protein G4B88_021724 [Cannabis sativa]|uniref:Auxin efflux carrier component n=1 Tax=Cannabis sativa TaxID=3483 RepID=A0A7J6FKH3_CANSA|nr:hypothetical protein G4B88_021724 [Cannabis sativa]
MITGKDFYLVLSAVVPLYSAMTLAYASVRWWKIFTPEQCAGVNRFVAIIAVPFLTFKLMIHNNPYEMNLKLILADTLQKIVIFVVLVAWKTLSKKGSLEWTITLNSLSTLPNTLVMGVPLLKAMYGDFSASLMVQIVVFQGILWNTLLLVMFEYRAAKILINENFPDTAGSIASFKADADVVSLADTQAEAEIDTSGKIHVKVRRSSSLSTAAANSTLLSFRKIHGMGSAKSGASNSTNGLSGVEIYSTRSSFDNNQGADFGQEFIKPGSGRSDAIQLHMSVWNSSSAASSYNNRSFSSTDLHRNTFGASLDDITRKGPPSLRGNEHEKEEDEEEEEEIKKLEMPPASVVTKLILTMVCRKLVRNPNTYCSVIGLVWSLIAFRAKIEMPVIIEGIITILANTGLGMAMFSLGLFMALQPKIISCGKTMAAISLAVRFLVGPGVMAATSTAIGIRGILLQVAIVQAVVKNQVRVD